MKNKYKNNNNNKKSEHLTKHTSTRTLIHNQICNEFHFVLLYYICTNIYWLFTHIYVKFVDFVYLISIFVGEEKEENKGKDS